MSQEFYISGMTCRSCEVVIERSVREIDGVTDARVSLRTGKLVVEGGRSFSQTDIESRISGHGYRVSYQPHDAGRPRIRWGRLGGWMIIVFALYVLLNRFGLLTFSPSAADPAGWVAVFAIGLIASVSSCMAVVGGLVVAMSGQMAKVRAAQGARVRLRPHVYFNVGRLIGFAVFGSMIGWLGSVVRLSPTVNGMFIVVIAAFMILLGIGLLDVIPASILSMPKWLAHFVHDMSVSRRPFAPMLLGALTFFLPCGFTQSMQLYALSLQDPLQSGMVMFVFALGTLPALLGIGSVASVSSGKRLSFFTKAAGVVVLVLGLSNVANGSALMGYSVGSTFARAESSKAATIAAGVQYIQMEITDGFEYAPNVFTVKKGVPVEWSIYGGKFLGCANTLVSPGLGINTYIRSGINRVAFVPRRAGRFTFSCSMGMIRGTMIVTE